MPINDPSESLTNVGTPRVQLVIDGASTTRVVHASVSATNNFTATRWTAEVVPTDDDAFPLSFWDGLDPDNMPLVDVQMGYAIGDTVSWNSLVVGRIDNATYAPGTGSFLVSGRDRTADLIEAKTFNVYVNQTSSDIAKALAAPHGLLTTDGAGNSTITPTSTAVGRYFQTDHDHLTLGQFSRVTNEWDLLVNLAQLEGFDVFVEGNVLYFQPEVSPNADPFVLFCQDQGNWLRSNGIELHLDRAYTLARDIQVVVQSWNSRQKKKFSVSARALGARSAASSAANPKPGQSSTVQYVYVRPNLTHDQAQQLANQILADLSKHERVVDCRMPGNFLITPRTVLQVEGTGTSFDQTYFVSEIDWDISAQGGFYQQVRGKNQSPRNTTVVG